MTVAITPATTTSITIVGHTITFYSLQIIPDFEIILDAGKTDHFCEHVSFYNSNDPNKEISRPRVLIEILYTGAYGGVNKEAIKKLLQQTLDPNGSC